MTDKQQPLDTARLLLDHYHCTFFLPLAGLGDLMPVLEHAFEMDYDIDADSCDFQSWLFFTPVIRRILFPRKHNLNQRRHPHPIREWRLVPDLVDNLELDVGKDDNFSDPLKYQQTRLTRVTLYRFFNGLYLLAFQVEPLALDKLIPRDEKGDRGNLPLDEYSPQAMLSVPEQQADSLAELQLEAWLRFTRLARQLYPSFVEQWEEDKIEPIRLFNIRTGQQYTACAETLPGKLPESSGELFSNVVKQFLIWFFGESGKKQLDQALANNIHFYDDRLFVSAAYGLAKTDLPKTETERIFSLAFHVDRHQEAWKENLGHAYSPQAIRDNLREKSFRHWENLGGLYGFTDSANIYLYRGSFFRNVIAPRHISPIYDRMLALALLYRASLRWYDQKITDETNAMLEHDSDVLPVSARRKEFIRFTNQYWFHDVTEQMQGKEIFRLQQQGLNLKACYDILKDELERTHEYKIAEISDKIGRWGLLFAVAALYFTLLPALSDALKDAKDSTLWKLTGSWLVTGNDQFVSLTGFIITIIILPATAALAWLCCRQWLRRKKNK